ncbi:GDSL lipase/esterase [Endogone sp. FLAS-F59071]|nr:GDSL lipase/esterase [Endogone sp. FLAS-F59071]|eukprot:RUS15153.1 GDSL lipase/esterase [Endogone sp. FLAS-F59071]
MLLLRGAILITLLCTTVASMTSGWRSKLPFKRIVVFGDSYSDSGFAYAFTNETIPISPPYAKKFSNGPVWVEYLAQMMDLHLENYACGGATTDNNAVQGTLGSKIVPGIAQQISNYYFPTLTPSKEATLDEVLYIIWANGNDFGDDQVSNPMLVAGRIISSIDTIHSKIPTAKHFLTLDLSGIGKIPYVVSTDQQVDPGNPKKAAAEAALADEVDALYNEDLKEAVGQYRNKTENTGVKLSLFPISKLFDYMSSPKGAADIRLKTVTEPCLKYFFYANDTEYITSVCNDAREYLYWDWYHPTTYIHKLIARAIKEFLESEYNAYSRRSGSRVN